MRWFECLRWYAAASVLRCSHLNRALCDFERMVKLNSLYIIGNGFDLHHGFNTRYSNFAEYLQ
ncbi:AbiH family protein, partial [Vibrio rotiferianus]|uniref:AbiH family protein n=1 Tax=Vibrio rotiferianus TaxID=190895 RepID=UPI0035A23EF4